VDEEARLREKLTELINEHRDLDDMIARLIDDSRCDQLKVQRLKKRKLMLKDEIRRLGNLLIPDIIA